MWGISSYPAYNTYPFVNGVSKEKWEGQKGVPRNCDWKFSKFHECYIPIDPGTTINIKRE
jgi:hypothetical protein